MSRDSYSLFFALDQLLDLQRAPPLAARREAAFNAAVAWDLLGIVESARGAWSDYLALDPRSDWAGDARRRLTALDFASRGRANADDEARNPVQLRGELFEQELPAWARAVIAGDESGAATLVSRILGPRGGAPATLEARIARDLLALEPPRRLELARGAIELSRGIALKRAFALEQADRTLESAIDHLDRSGSSVVWIARFVHGMTRYESGEFTAADRLLAAVSRAAPGVPDPLLHAQAEKGRGLVAQTEGHLGTAVVHYRAALRGFRDAGAGPEAIATTAILADGLLSAGEDLEAWQTLHRALADAWAQPTARSRYVVAAAASTMAQKRGLRRLGVEFDRLSLGALPVDADPVELADARTWYAQSLAAAGALDKAAVELNAVRALLTRVGDASAAMRADADLAYTEARRALALGRYGDAAASARRAADYYRAKDLLVHAVPCLGLEGLALARLGRTGEALRALRQAVALAERDGEPRGKERPHDVDDPAVDLRDALMSLLLDRGESAQAFALALDSVTLGDHHDGARGAPRGATGTDGPRRAPGMPLLRANSELLLAYPLPDRVVAWRMVDGALAVESSALPRKILRASVQGLVADVQSGVEAGTWTKKGRALAAQVLGGAATPRSGRSVLLLTTPDLSDLPWALLLGEPATGPSDYSFVTVAQPTRSPRVPSAVNRAAACPGDLLVVADPELAPSEDFVEPLRGARAEATSIAAAVGSRSRLLIGEAADKASVLELSARAHAIHLGVHAIVDPVDPDASYLLLRGENGSRARWTPREIRDLEFDDLDLVVLAACHSSFRSTSLTTNALGLAEAFLVAGARAVVATSWPVEDYASRQLVESFYRELARGRAVGESLAAAQKDSVRRLGPESLRTVAAFKLLGDPFVAPFPTQVHEGGIANACR